MLCVGLEEDYFSIVVVLLVVDSGDVVEIYVGIYYEYGLVVDKLLYIWGIGYLVFDVQEQGEILIIIVYDVMVEGLQLQNVGVSYFKDYVGIWVWQCSWVIICNNWLVNIFFGIYLEWVYDVVIENNELSGVLCDEVFFGNGIYVWYCENLDICDNWVIGYCDGIYFEFVDSSKIVGNESVGNQCYGLYFMFFNYDEYYYN